jgi:hypothetical protein
MFGFRNVVDTSNYNFDSVLKGSVSAVLGLGLLCSGPCALLHISVLKGSVSAVLGLGLLCSGPCALLHI